MKTLLYILLVFFAILITTNSGWAGTATLSWDPNTESDLAGYKVYYGTASGSYSPAIDVGNVTSHTVSSLTDGQTYYFAVTAYDTSGNESGFSNEVSKLIGATTGGGSSGGGGGGGCGMVRDISGRSGSSPSQVALNLALLALLLSLGKMQAMIKRRWCITPTNFRFFSFLAW